jgi:hypothetical protein
MGCRPRMLTRSTPISPIHKVVNANCSASQRYLFLWFAEYRNGAFTLGGRRTLWRSSAIENAVLTKMLDGACFATVQYAVRRD